MENVDRGLNLAARDLATAIQAAARPDGGSMSAGATLERTLKAFAQQVIRLAKEPNSPDGVSPE